LTTSNITVTAEQQNIASCSLLQHAHIPNHMCYHAAVIPPNKLVTSCLRPYGSILSVHVCYGFRKGGGAQVVAALPEAHASAGEKGSCKIIAGDMKRLGV
jgi:hypothetical protein